MDLGTNYPFPIVSPEESQQRLSYACDVIARCCPDSPKHGVEPYYPPSDPALDPDAARASQPYRNPSQGDNVPTQTHVSCPSLCLLPPALSAPCCSCQADLPCPAPSATVLGAAGCRVRCGQQRHQRLRGPAVDGRGRQLPSQGHRRAVRALPPPMQPFPSVPSFFSVLLVPVLVSLPVCSLGLLTEVVASVQGRGGRRDHLPAERNGHQLPGEAAAAAQSAGRSRRLLQGRKARDGRKRRRHRPRHSLGG